MADIGIFPSLPGLAWSVTKTPTFQTRIQRAASGRELRALDYPYPLWQFTLVFDFLRDNPSAGFNELRTLMGFYMLCQGAYSTFLFDDPTDNQVSRQILPAAISTVSGAPGVGAGGSGYVTGDVVKTADGTLAAIGGAAASFSVTASAGAITALTTVNPGAYAVIPGTTAVNLTGGSGSGGRVDLAWTTSTQLVRTFGDPSLAGGGFAEAVTASNLVNTIYYDGIVQTGWSVGNNGIVTLAGPFFSAQPVISADFSYYFRCRFIDDSYAFENFMYRLWQLKKLTFISVRP
jgi:hypothetical protein